MIPPLFENLFVIRHTTVLQNVAVEATRFPRVGLHHCFHGDSIPKHGHHVGVLSVLLFSQCPFRRPPIEWYSSISRATSSCVISPRMFRLAVSIKNCDTLKRSTSCKPMATLQLLARCRTSGSGSSLNSAKIPLAALGARTALSCLVTLKLFPPFQMTCKTHPLPVRGDHRAPHIQPCL